MDNNKIRLIAEWEEQDAVIISWPHKNTDWSYILEEVDQCYKNIVSSILRYENVIILTPEVERVEELICDIDQTRFQYSIIEMQTNDTWIRDYGPISYDMNIEGKDVKAIADFTFNGWGMKFSACHDNLVNRCLYLSRTFASDVSIINRLILAIEGGAIESDGKGTVMTTSSVMFEPNRNPGFQGDDIMDIVSESLGAKHILMLNNGALEGDDTDGHIDTLARFLSPDTIAYVKCDDSNDIHFHELNKMEEELKKFVDINGNQYKLVALPHPKAIFDDNGDRLPATYANFLFVNGAILLPTYNQESDKEAIEILQKEFPTKDIVSIDCNALIKQHGSLHCATMQIPKGFLNKNKFNNFQ